MADRRLLWMWLGMLGAMTLVVAAAVSPPVLPEPWRAAMMAAFSPACHQIPARSPHVHGVTIAVCDRCIGIYGGAWAGLAMFVLLRPFWRWAGAQGRFVLLGALIPLGVDWLAPFVGLWSNTPLSRALTGVVFGVVAASFLAHQLSRRVRAPADG